MPTETPTVTPNWNGLEGKVLEGGYEIEKCLNAGETSAAFKVRILGDRFTSAIAHVSAPGTVKPEQIALWREASQLRHPNLLTPLSIGSFDLDDTPLPYRVMVRPDETLSSVIKERALTPEETREVLKDVVSALEYLHANGFVHSEVSPDQVLAIGNSVKLSTGSVRRINAPLEGEKENPAPAGDIFRLGAMVFEILTQKPCVGDCREGAEKLPAPFGEVVRRSLDPDPQNRCSLADIRAILAGEPVTARVVGEPAKPTPGTSTVKPVVAQRETPPPPAQASFVRERREETFRFSAFRKSAYWLVALLLAVGVLWLARPKHPRPQPSVGPQVIVGRPASASTAPRTERTAAATGTAWPTRALGPQPADFRKTATPQTVLKAATPQAQAVRGQVWRVISYTYNRESDAQKRVEWISTRYSEFHPEVFSPKGNGGPYLVVLGGTMNKEDAGRLRQKARASGLPRDSYIQNYNR